MLYLVYLTQQSACILAHKLQCADRFVLCSSVECIHLGIGVVFDLSEVDIFILK